MRSVTIIIPVYNAFDVTIDCLHSVSQHSPQSVKVVVIDDASPSGELVSIVPDDIKSDPRFVFIRNEHNLGFVGSCNRGMLFESAGDVILLNSDTVVTPRWVQKLTKAAYSRRRIGTVTPLTNNGTIASIPRFLENNDLPLSMSINQFADVVERLSVREYVSVPTCVGFCTYVRREMLDEIGVFDPVFKKGYGEENDLSLRGAAAGFDNIIDDATYVYHRGSMSFKEMREALSRENLKILNQRYPGYDARIAEFCGANPLSRVHDRVWNYLQNEFVRTKERSVLHILPNGPFFERSGALGAVELLVQNIIRNDQRSAHFSLVATPTCFYLTVHLACGDRTLILPSNFNLSILLRREMFDLLHVHASSSFNVHQLAHTLQRHGSYVLSVHDQDAWRNLTEAERADNLIGSSKRIVTYVLAPQEAWLEDVRKQTRIDVRLPRTAIGIDVEQESAFISDLYSALAERPKARPDSLAGTLQPDLVQSFRNRLARLSSMIRRTLIRLEAA